MDNRNISDLDELIRLAQSVGLPATEARDVLRERRFQEAVDADWVKSQQYGITGVPTFASGRHGVVGAPPYEALEQFVSTARRARDETAFHHRESRACGGAGRGCLAREGPGRRRRCVRAALSTC